MTQQAQRVLHFLLQCHGSIFLDVFELGNARCKLTSLLDFSALLLNIFWCLRRCRRVVHPIAGCFVDAGENISVEIQESMQVCIHCVETFAGLTRLYQPSRRKNQKWEPVF